MDDKPPPPPNPATDQQPTRPPPPPTTSASATPSQPTHASRIQTSATGLLNNALSSNASGSTGNDISATFAAGLSGKGGGGGGSSAGAGSGGRGVSLAREGVSTGGFRPSQSIRSNGHEYGYGHGDHATGPGTGSSTSAVRDEFKHFEQNNTLDGGSSNESNNTADLSFLRQLSSELEQETVSAPISPAEWDQGLLRSSRSSSNTGKGKARETTTQDSSDVTPFLERAWEQQQQQQQKQSNAALDSNTDGHAVTSLLSDPSFQPLDFDDNLDLDDDDISSQPNPYLAPAPSTQQQQQQQQQQINPLSLIPGLSDHLLSTSPHEPTLTEQEISSLSETLDLSLSAADEPWLPLDAAYHDAVYGNWIEPYVVAAREEVRESETKGGNIDGAGPGPAVRRLGLVLGHLRGRVG